MKEILGIDEAGRGAVVGPIVIAGLLFNEEKLGELKALNVKDSKKLSGLRRKELEKKIKKIAKDWLLISVSAKVIDARKNLNDLELSRFAKIINIFNPRMAIVDSLEAEAEKFKEKLKAKLSKKVKLIVENYADQKYPLCSGASILAKVKRDEEIVRIEKEINLEVGKGYPSDLRTREFLKKSLEQGRGLEYVRKSWITFKELVKEKEQKKVFDF